MSPSKKATKRAADARQELGDLPEQLAEVAKLSGAALTAKYREVLGVTPKSKNQQHLRKRIAIELQVKAKGGLKPEEEAHIKKVQAYALEKGLWPRVDGAEVQAIADAKASPADRDLRLPPPGSTLVREYSNEKHHVKVREDGFEYRGTVYRSLSKVAREISGTTWNGFLFFNLVKRSKP